MNTIYLISSDGYRDSMDIRDFATDFIGMQKLIAKDLSHGLYTPTSYVPIYDKYNHLVKIKVSVQDSYNPAYTGSRTYHVHMLTSI